MTRKKVLIADDMELNREILAVALEDNYDLIEAEDGVQAIERLKEYGEQLSAVLLDLVMPNMNGYGVMSYMRSHGLLAHIPVLIISASSGETEQICLKNGASDFIHKPFDHEIIRSRVQNIIELFTYKRSLEAQVAAQTEALLQQNRLLEEQAVRLRETNEKIISVLGTVVEYRNLESGEHVQRVKGFTRIMAQRAAVMFPEYGLTPHRIDVIVSASAMHDIGKIAIEDRILLKPGRLTREEFEQMKTHTTRGYDILNQITGVWDEEYGTVSREICRHHHERYDGRGYPDGLVGEEIPISAQLVSVADVYDALVSERCYKKAFDKETAYRMILNGECGAFSPKMLACFSASKAEFEALADRLRAPAPDPAAVG